MNKPLATSNRYYLIGLYQLRLNRLLEKGTTESLALAKQIELLLHGLKSSRAENIALEIKRTNNITEVTFYNPSRTKILGSFALPHETEEAKAARMEQLLGAQTS